MGEWREGTLVVERHEVIPHTDGMNYEGIREVFRVYIEPKDRWIGYYRGDTHHYVCPLPCVVIRWRRRADLDGTR